jgi:hypothetical protein
VTKVKLYFCIGSYVIAQASVAALHWHPNWLYATWTAMGFHGLCMVFSLFTHLTSFKADLDDKSIEIADSK